ncbi:metallophosphoesterase [Sulfodiicoccus acidiphilus]|uniref:Metallophosphoesterase n=1 Tax=Sulfodiicoccus acidiphilus TaxID=1670455 RepID=A0A348B406_9CREN|nr:metallophosphoesterase [Sulfodiicoccus acidiphilus]BBD72908.1 metallophosphoesterase [Sulfodiicoccus acidiphilus]GGT88093.1 metallophosphoesterase [Sulfodiicoccus acidiphilus]
MRLFRKGETDERSGKIKVLYASDIHGSETTFRKFLNASQMYGADIMIIGGDLAGKALVPIVDLGEGKYEVDGKVVGREEMQRYVKELRKKGDYHVIVDRKGFQELNENPARVKDAFREAMTQVLRDWFVIAEQKTKERRIPFYVNLGNDDPEYLFDVLKESEIMEPSEGKVVEVAGHEMVSFGYVNPTPWNTPREMDEERLYSELKAIVNKIREPARAIYNFHAPPYETLLDNAPQLTSDLRVVVRGGEIVMTHVGSKAVRRIIEETSPALGIHGHIHESRGTGKLGSTIILNPGSQYSAGMLQGALITFEGGKVKGVQLFIG